MRKPTPRSGSRIRTTALRSDDTYGRIYDTFVELLKQHPEGVIKDEILRDAKAKAWKTSMPWKRIVHWVTEQPGVVILPLTWRSFASPKDKKAHSVDPSKYLAPNYSTAAGFADLVPFVEHSERNRQIALTKYTQQQLAAARAVERAEQFSAAIGSHQPAIEAPG